MRQKRAKAYRKLMSLYSMTFGFRQPYQVLGTPPSTPTCAIHPPNRANNSAVDSHMCEEAVEHKIDLVKQLGVVLQGTVKPSECPLFSSLPSLLETTRIYETGAYRAPAAKPFLSDHPMLHPRALPPRAPEAARNRPRKDVRAPQMQPPRAHPGQRLSQQRRRSVSLSHSL